MNVEELLDEFQVPQHVRKHCEVVAKLCLFIGEKIPGVNLELIEKAALLHDLVRVCDFRDWDPEKFPECEDLREKYKGRCHEEVAAEILESRGEPELAALIKSHKFSNILKKEPFKNWEEKILYYADKIVDGDEVVSLEEGLSRGAVRNVRTPEEKRISKEARPKVFALEKEICKAAGVEVAMDFAISQ